MNDHPITADYLRKHIAEILHSLIENGDPPQAVADAAIAVGAALRQEVSGPLSAAQHLLDQARLAAMDAGLALVAQHDPKPFLKSLN